MYPIDCKLNFKADVNYVASIHSPIKSTNFSLNSTFKHRHPWVNEVIASVNKINPPSMILLTSLTCLVNRSQHPFEFKSIINELYLVLLNEVHTFSSLFTRVDL